MSSSFQFLDDIALADIAFEAKGDSAEELFCAATRALLETLADPTTVEDEWERKIHCAGDDLASLLFEWLSEIVYWKDAEGVVFHDAQLRLRQDNGKWFLVARLQGAPVDRVRQELRNDVKGITKHLYEVRQDGLQWRARVVLDV